MKDAYLSKIYYYANIQDSALSNTIVAFTSQVRASAVLLPYEIRVRYGGNNHTELRKIVSADSKFEMGSHRQHGDLISLIHF
jgi:hypothetical protein